MACAFTTKMELAKVDDNQIRIITKGPKDSDHTVTLGNEVQEEDPFDNTVKVREIMVNEMTQLGM